MQSGGDHQLFYANLKIKKAPDMVVQQRLNLRSIPNDYYTIETNNQFQALEEIGDDT